MCMADTNKFSQIGQVRSSVDMPLFSFSFLTSLFHSLSLDSIRLTGDNHMFQTAVTLLLGMKRKPLELIVSHKFAMDILSDATALSSGHPLDGKREHPEGKMRKK